MDAHSLRGYNVISPILRFLFLYSIHQGIRLMKELALPQSGQLTSARDLTLCRHARSPGAPSPSNLALFPPRFPVQRTASTSSTYRDGRGLRILFPSLLLYTVLLNHLVFRSSSTSAVSFALPSLHHLR